MVCAAATACLAVSDSSRACASTFTMSSRRTGARAPPSTTLNAEMLRPAERQSHVEGRLLGHRRASTTNRFVDLDHATLSRGRLANRGSCARAERAIGPQLALARLGGLNGAVTATAA